MPDFLATGGDRGPVHVAHAEFHAEAFSESLGVAFFPAELFNMEVEEPGPGSRDPLFGPAVVDDVASIDVPDHPGALDLVNEPGRLQRTEQEVVPRVFDADFAVGFLGPGNGGLNGFLGSLLHVGVGGVLVDESGDKQQLFAAHFARLPEGALEPSEALRADGRIVVGKGLAPLRGTDNPGNLEAACVPGANQAASIAPGRLIPTP